MRKLCQLQQNIKECEYQLERDRYRFEAGKRRLLAQFAEIKQHLPIIAIFFVLGTSIISFFPRVRNIFIKINNNILKVNKNILFGLIDLLITKIIFSQGKKIIG